MLSVFLTRIGGWYICDNFLPVVKLVVGHSQIGFSLTLKWTIGIDPPPLGTADDETTGFGAVAGGIFFALATEGFELTDDEPDVGLLRIRLSTRVPFKQTTESWLEIITRKGKNELSLNCFEQVGTSLSESNNLEFEKVRKSVVFKGIRGSWIIKRETKFKLPFVRKVYYMKSSRQKQLNWEKKLPQQVSNKTDNTLVNQLFLTKFSPTIREMAVWKYLGALVSLKKERDESWETFRPKSFPIDWKQEIIRWKYEYIRINTLSWKWKEAVVLV